MREYCLGQAIPKIEVRFAGLFRRFSCQLSAVSYQVFADRYHARESRRGQPWRSKRRRRGRPARKERPGRAWLCVRVFDRWSLPRIFRVSRLRRLSISLLRGLRRGFLRLLFSCTSRGGTIRTRLITLSGNLIWGVRLRAALVVGRVEARALKGDAHRTEDLPDRGVTLEALCEGVIKYTLHYVEGVSVLTLVLVDRHVSSNTFCKSLRPRDYTTSGSPVRLVSGAWWRFRIQPPGGEVLPHLLVGGLDEFGVVEKIFDLFLGRVAADILFLDYVPKVGSFADAVADVFHNLPLPLLVALFQKGTVKELVPERSSFLGHAVLSFPSVVSPSNPRARNVFWRPDKRFDDLDSIRRSAL